MKRFAYLILLLCVIPVSAQKEAAVWYFGGRAGLDFNSGAPIALNDGALFTPEGCATISDFNGNLLFYTDGITVWNRDHQPMSNGTGLNGDPSSTQSGIIVPYPGNPDLYYVFTVDIVANGNGLQYSLVDMTLDGGLGVVTTKNQQLETPVAEKLTAVAHNNGTDIWVLAHRMGGNKFVAYLVTPTGLQTTPVVTAIGGDFTTISQSAGYLKFSPDGNLLASASTGGAITELFQFDATAGILSNRIDLTSFYTKLHSDTGLTSTYGVEFSSDSSKLYITSNSYGDGVQYNDLYQFDLTILNTGSIITSAQKIATQPVEMAALQLAIDGKIYVTQVDERYLGVINSPNTAGLASGYVDNSISLAPGVSILGLPPFITTYFIVGIKAEFLCLGKATEFSVEANDPITSISWDFGDGNTSSLENPTNIYAASGTYTVSVTVNTVSETKTESKDITIYESPTANPVTNFEICNITTAYEFDLSTKNAEVLGGQVTSNHIIAYYPTVADAQNGTNPLPFLYTNTAAVENITARISNKDNPSCYDTESFDLIVKEAPVLNPVSDWTVCDTDLDGFYDFYLSEKNAEILNGQSSATFSVSYYETLSDADVATNMLSPTYTNTSSQQQLFFRIENTSHPNCYETGSFDLEVIKQVLMNEPSNLVVCDDDNDGFYTFDLTTKYNEIIFTSNNFEVDITFHLTGEDVNNGTNAIDVESFTNTVAYSQNLYIRAAHKERPECYSVANIELTINDSPNLEAVDNWQVCDDDRDGAHTFDLTEKDGEILGAQSSRDFSISYHQTQADANANVNAVTGPFRNTVNLQTLFYRKENNNNTNCFITDSFILEVFDRPTAGTPSPIIACDENETGILSFDLSSKDVEVLNEQNPNDFTVSYFASQNDADNNQNPMPKGAYTNSQLSETIFVRIHNKYKTGCYDTTHFEIILNPLPQPDLEETYVICPDSPELIIDGGDYETWSWLDENGNELDTTRNINIIELGDYTLTATQSSNGIACEKTIPFKVVSSGAPEDFTTEISDPSDNVTIIVTTTGIGDFEYSSDGENYQTSNRLEVFPGEHTIFVRDKFLCRTITKRVIALGYQKFFTPNGDGANEFWNIIGAYNYPESQLYIYDRYGKLLQQISPMANGWDGTYNGLPLPSSDYWFRYIFDGGKVFTGHFALKR